MWIRGLSTLLAASLAAVPAAGGGTVSTPRGALTRIVSRDDSGRIALWDFAGALQAGWPVAASGAWPAGTPRLQDLDGDGQPEVVCLLKSLAGGRLIRAWRLDGRPCPGFESIPAPADMDDTPEIADVEGTGAAQWVWPTASGGVSISRPGDPGHPLPSFPVQVAAGRLRLRVADVDGDGALEVLGGADEGATGRWFILSVPRGDPTLFSQPTPEPVVSAPRVTRSLAAGAPRILVALRSQAQVWAPDGARGYQLVPGWPVSPGPAADGDMSALVTPPGLALARGGAGCLAAYTISGDRVRGWAEGARLGATTAYADFADLNGASRWIAHARGNQLLFQVPSGVDSTGRPTLYSRELGDRHHGSYTRAPAGLLPIVQFRIWLNGSESRPGAPPAEVLGSGLLIHGALDSPSLAGDPELVMEVVAGPKRLASCHGHAVLDLRVDLEPGRYQVLGCVGADTLGRADFEIKPQLTLRNVYAYPNPVRERCALLFDLGADADVAADLYTVAGRRIRSLAAHFAAGHDQLQWDGLDARGRPAANGVYMFRIRAVAGAQRAEFVGKLMCLN